MSGGLVRSRAAHAAGGFVLMGSWAVFANSGHPMPAPLVAGLVQGALTAAITLVLKRIVEAICARIDRPLSLFAAPLAAGAVSLGLLTAIHGLAGTPALFATISVPLIVSVSYAAIYARLQ